MKERMHTDIVLNAILMAVWWRKPTQRVIIHSDQGHINQRSVAILPQATQSGSIHEPPGKLL